MGVVALICVRPPVTASMANSTVFRGDCAFRHLECRRDRAIGKQSFSTAQRYRKYLQPERIDQIMLEEFVSPLCVQVNPYGQQLRTQQPDDASVRPVCR